MAASPSTAPEVTSDAPVLRLSPPGAPAPALSPQVQHAPEHGAARVDDDGAHPAASWEPGSATLIGAAVILLLPLWMIAAFKARRAASRRPHATAGRRRRERVLREVSA